MFNDVYQNTLNLQDNNAGISLEGFVVAGKLSSPSVAIPEVKTRRNSTAIASRPLIPASRKLMMGVYVLKIALSTNILLLSGNIALNPGPVNSNITFSSNESMMPGSGISDSERDYSTEYFNLGLSDKGLRIGHWNVNYLTTEKFEQIELYLLGKSSPGKSQLDVLFLSEIFLNSSVPDSLYTVNGFSIFRRERLLKGGGGIMVFMSNDLTVKRRTDLESHDAEAIWLEVYPFKSKRSIILGSIYRPPSSKQADDTNIEANIGSTC